MGIIRDGVEALIADGVSFVQLDAPFYEVVIDPAQRQRLRESGNDPDQLTRDTVEADQGDIAGLRRRGLTLALFVCRGNSRSRWLAEGGYYPIAEPLFGSLNADLFLLDCDSHATARSSRCAWCRRRRTSCSAW